MRDLAFVIVLAGLVPVSFFRPWIGVLAWSWIAYMAPHKMMWTYTVSHLPVAMLIGGATIAGFLLSKKDRKSLPRAPEIFLLILLALHFTLTTALSINPDVSWPKWNFVSKSLLITFVTMWLFQDRSRLRWLYMVIALSLGFYGLKGGLWILRTGGENMVLGPDDTFFGDNNTLGLALSMTLPLLLGLSRDEPRRWLKWLLRAIFAASVIAIPFTYSRGAFLGLVVILFMLIWRSPWRLRFAAAIGIAVLIALPFVPLNLQERIQSIQNYEQDSSAIGRLQAWSTGYNLALDRPLVGGGFRAFWDDSVWNRYHPGEYIRSRDAHSLYFEVLGEHGFLGLAIYLALLITVFLSLRRVRKRWRGHPEHGWLSRYADMTELTLYPFLIAGAFLQVAYFDLYFHLIAATVMLKVLSAQAEATTIAAAPAPAVSRVSTRH